MTLACLLVAAGALGAWTFVLGWPGPEAAVSVFTAIWAVGFGLFTRYGAPFPMKGRPPEEVAAERFLAGDDARSDDNRLDFR